MFDMYPSQKRELKRQAWMRLSAQRRHAGMLRGRVVALSLICFVVLWGVVFARMATGNDPVLSGKKKAIATRAAAGPRQEIETTDPGELEPEVEVVEAEPEEAEVPVQEIETQPEPEPLVTSQS
ncbi:MAG TPA: hypothetical protein VHU86_08955 [Solirubrobacterales bacterium]|jgi:hypothetical protein|nr:hypothetical protein [Solirubrobacterales bacterium]